jgi:phosphoribosylformimino-5-aminoimidazole carboxamide ribotide isomerase
MLIYPAIDLYEGKVVRLIQGDFQKATVYSDKPEDMAHEWEIQGAEWIHVVDLEGAKSGKLSNYETLLKIRDRVQCKLQFGGGLRDIETVQRVLKEGIDRVVIGTKSLDQEFLKKILQKYAAQAAVGLDVRQGIIQVEGWAKGGTWTLRSAIEWMNEFPLGMLIYTDIQKDGMLEGPNFSALTELMNWTKSRVILSGGVSSMTDIQRACEIRNHRFEGMIVGKALYEKRFSLREAVQLAKQSAKLK